MRLVEVHGFNVRDRGEGTTGTLRAYFLGWGHEVDSDGADYGWHFLVKVRFGFLHYEAIQRITCAIAAADAVITHSNGANYFNKAANLLHGIWPEKRLLVAHISPALDQDAPFPANVEHAWVLHTPHDQPVKWARVLRGHPWGAMGAYGPDPVPTNVTPLCYPHITGHSNWFAAQNREATARVIHQAFTDHADAARQAVKEDDHDDAPSRKPARRGRQG